MIFNLNIRDEAQRAQAVSRKPPHASTIGDMKNIIIHNQGKDRLATIDPNGELHLYSFDPTEEEVKHISYLHL